MKYDDEQILNSNNKTKKKTTWNIVKTVKQQQKS